MIVVAEGVEDEAQLAWLRDVGYRHIQGYLLGRPVPPEHIDAHSLRRLFSR
jgi:EAL domain-containing protein (putative c-di-GMP-specific phosphodiesterase class I)